MKPEVKFKSEDYNYYNRTVGVIKKDDHYLILNVDNSSYYHIPGGHLEIGEDSLEGVKREIMEELSYTVKEASLFCIQENFYEKKGIIQHGVEFYYLLEVKEEVELEERIITEIDRGVEKKLSVKWVTADELKNLDLRPFTVRDLLISGDLTKLTHIIQRD